MRLLRLTRYSVLLGDDAPLLHGVYIILIEEFRRGKCLVYDG